MKTLRAQLIKVAHEFSAYLPEPLEPEDCDELMHLLEPVLQAERARARRIVRAVQRDYISQDIKWACEEILTRLK